MSLPSIVQFAVYPVILQLCTNSAKFSLLGKKSKKGGRSINYFVSMFWKQDVPIFQFELMLPVENQEGGSFLTVEAWKINIIAPLMWNKAIANCLVHWTVWRIYFLDADWWHFFSSIFLNSQRATGSVTYRATSSAGHPREHQWLQPRVKQSVSLRAPNS